MLTAFVLIQTGINLILILGVVRLLRSREATTHELREREARLEALAATLCALGSDVTHPMPGAPATAASAPIRMDRHRAESSEAGKSNAGSGCRAPVAVTDRVRSAAALLEQGETVERVAARIPLLAGEVQVLQNLRRASQPSGGCPRHPERSAVEGGSTRSTRVRTRAKSSQATFRGNRSRDAERAHE